MRFVLRFVVEIDFVFADVCLFVVEMKVEESNTSHQSKCYSC